MRKLRSVPRISQQEGPAIIPHGPPGADWERQGGKLGITSQPEPNPDGLMSGEPKSFWLGF